MKRDLKDALKNRRTYYSIAPKSPISDAQLEELVKFAVLHTPSAFNSQSSRLVLLLGKSHKSFWEIIKAGLKKITSPKSYAAAEANIDGAFASGYGTVLFFEDASVVKKLQEAYPTYAAAFPTWSQHSSAMHQYALWTLLEDAGLGASLQHYITFADAEVRAAFVLPESWHLTAQMPFGLPVNEPPVKEFAPLDERVKIFK